MYESSDEISTEQRLERNHDIHTNEIAVLVLGHTCLRHGLVEHLCLRFADEFVGAVVAVRHAFEEIIDLQ